jgi:hypothetical protein
MSKNNQKRKVISTDSLVFGRTTITMATCNDGTVLKYKHEKNATWEVLPEIPQ